MIQLIFCSGWRPPSSSSQALTTTPWEYGTSPRSSRSLSWQATRATWRQLRLTGAGNTWRQVRWRRLEACCAIFSRHFLECWACVLLRAECWFWCGWWWGRCDGGGDDVIVFDAIVSHEMWLVVGFVWCWWWSVGDVTMLSVRCWLNCGGVDVDGSAVVTQLWWWWW